MQKGKRSTYLFWTGIDSGKLVIVKEKKEMPFMSLKICPFGKI